MANCLCYNNVILKHIIIVGCSNEIDGEALWVLNPTVGIIADRRYFLGEINCFVIANGNGPVFQTSEWIKSTCGWLII